ncbi:hypothetical protein QZH41_019845 [Actinostola sp. cb2023]|nr:hypothetical protein QZH41_019845 [Actinostola sp. cb2023]
MVYFDSWDEFAKAIEQLYFAEPNKFRFVIKYRHCNGKIVIKGTDDQMVSQTSLQRPQNLSITTTCRACLKYRTEQQQDLKKFEKLNSVLMRHMASR